MSFAVDCHCHISDARLFPERTQYVKRCEEDGVRWFVLGGVNPNEWDRQLILREEFPEQILCCFGLHPYFVSEASRDELESAFARLPNALNSSFFMGEMGLDFRKEILRDRREIQEEFFARQLELCAQQNKVAVLHIVRAHSEALGFLRHQKVRGMIHAFNSSWEVATRYLSEDFYLSLGARILGPEHSQVLREIPLDRVLIESDAPDQPPRGMKQHDSSTVLLVAQALADNKGLTADEVLEKTRQNLETLMGRRLQ